MEQKDVQLVPVRLFLTDFTSCPTTHPAIDLKVKIDCESTKPTCILPNKPKSFDSYTQFTDWLNQGYFVNQIMIAYDFHVDVQKSAPSLAQHLLSFLTGGYHFIGTYTDDNTSMKPDKCMPQVTYCSKRGTINATTATLGGTFYLNSCAYPINDHHQIFTHPMIEQEVFKKDETKKFYHHQWVAQSEVTSKVTHEEFPTDLTKNWPQAPSETYSMLQKKPGDLEEIDHLACMDGSSGEDIDISDGRIFLIDCDMINKKDAKFLESIVKDADDNLYIARYLYSESGKKKAEARLQAAKEIILQKEQAAASSKEEESRLLDHRMNEYAYDAYGYAQLQAEYKIPDSQIKNLLSNPLHPRSRDLELELETITKLVQAYMAKSYIETYENTYKLQRSKTPTQIGTFAR